MDLNLKNIFSSFTKSAVRSPKRVLGIDIGSSAIKVVEVEQTERALTLRTYGELQLGPYAEKGMGEAVTLEPEKLVEALVDVIRESNCKAKDGVLAIPLSASFITVIPITVKEKETVDSKIRVEARKYIPVPLSDVTLDWSELHQYGDKDARVHEILLAAIQNDAFERYQKLLNAVKMVSQPSEIEVFSSIRSLTSAGDPKDFSFAVIDLGAEISKLYVVKNGSLERLHRVYDGGATCTKRIAHMLSMPFEDAENLKRTYRQDAEHARDIYKAYVSSIERSTQEFRRVIEQYEAREGNAIGRVLITGGAAGFPGVEKYMGDILSREVQKAMPFEKVAYPAFMEDTLKEVGLSFATALGAALRPFETGAE